MSSRGGSLMITRCGMAFFVNQPNFAKKTICALYIFRTNVIPKSSDIERSIPYSSHSTSVFFMAAINLGAKVLASSTR